MFGAGVFVLEALGFLLGGRKDLTQSSGEADLRAAMRARQPIELGTNRRRQRHRIRVHLPDDLRNDSFFLLEEHQEQVLGKDLGVAFAIGKLLRREDRLLRFLGVLIDIHFLMLAGPHPRSLSLGGYAPRSGRRRC